MKSKLFVTWCMAFCAAMGLFIESAVAQNAHSVAGTYAVVVNAPFGDSPFGQMILGSDGHYSIILARTTLPKIAAGTRGNGTEEENKAILIGSIAHFGKYLVDAQQKTITFYVEASTFPNWNGTTLQRPLKVLGDQLTFTNSAPSSGGPANDVVWKRLK